MVALKDYLPEPTTNEVLDALVALLRQAGFPVASWAVGSVLRHLTSMEALYLSDLAALVGNVTRGGFLRYASGAWLDLVAESFFSETRNAAIRTVGYVTVTDSKTQGPITIEANSWWFSDSQKLLRFVNRESATVPLGGSATVSVIAEQAGSGYNLVVGAITEVLSPGGTGATVTNSAVGDSWIITNGIDQETDEAFQARCIAKWSTLGAGGSTDAYKYQALNASAEVTRVNVVGNSSTGNVTVYVCGPSARVSDAALALVNAALLPPLCVRATAVHADIQTVAVNALVQLKSGTSQASATTDILTAIAAFARDTDLGGTVYLSALVAAFHSVSSVKSVAVTLPIADVALTENAIPLIVPTLSYV